MENSLVPCTRRIKTQCVVPTLLLCLVIFFSVNRVTASCIDLDDVPLDTQEQAAPGIVMFVIDDSGSMDWEFICQGSTDGKFRGSIEYLFADPGDNVYDSSSSNGDILEGSSYANYWQSQWAGHNRLYYDPSEYYAPWPSFSDVDPDNPPSNPHLSGNTLDLNAVYDDFSNITSADILNAGGSIVDNSDIVAGGGGATTTTAEILAAGGTIVDNSDVEDSGGGIVVDNQDAEYSESGSWYESGAGDEYNDSSKYSSQNGASATWTPNLPADGNYRVYVWYTNNYGWYNRDDNALYSVHFSGNDHYFRIDQDTNGGQWVDVGEYYFQAGSSGYVRVTHDDHSNGNTSADAVKFEPQFAVPLPDAAFSSSTGWNLSTAGGYGGNYLYTSGGSRTYTATWTANNLDTSETYNVYARWYGGGDNRQTEVHYKTYDNAVQVADTSVNQRNDHSTWIRIAEGVTFSSGIGQVEIDEWADNSGLCSDAVAFVPGAGSGTLPDAEFIEGSGWSSSADGNQYGLDYLYSNGGNMTYNATWIANNLDTTETFDVYARWTGGGSSRLTDVHYYTTHDGGVEDTTVNQQQDHGVWTQIADNVSFSTGTGQVDINQYAGNSGLCADAVAFVPHDTISPIVIGRAHYYVQNGAGTFLVNLYNGSRNYYRVNDNNGNGQVEMGELERMYAPAPANAGIVTGRSYGEERQNFANWYSYYRKRELTAKNAIAKVINEMQGVYIGMHFINNSSLASIAKPVKVDLGDKDTAGNPVIYDESSTLLQRLYDEQIASNSTPLRNGLRSAGRYFTGDFGNPGSGSFPTGSFSVDSYPYFTSDKGGTCQQSFTILMTDGYYNGGDPSDVANDDGDNSSIYDGSPYADSVSDTLADVAMYYYERDLNNTLNDDVPINNIDHANHQHMVTYTLSFGVEGSINQTLYPDCIKGGVCPSPWPDPDDGNLEKIDDMYHAAVNGRGKYVDAASPQEMVDSMTTLKQDIESRLGSSASVTTNSIQRQVGNVLYQGIYNTAGWSGEVRAIEVDVTSGSINTSDPFWLASQNLPAWEDRNIVSFNGTSSIEFTFDSITSTQQAILGNNGHDVQDLINYLRGDPSNDLSNGGPFRVRTNLIGDVVHSSPTYFKGFVYVGANDGMLHCFDADTGEEIFAYVPNMVYGHLSDLALPGYSHRYYVDNTPTAGRVNGKDLIICGLGKGGKGYFGLDVTTPETPTALWEYTNDDDLGYSFSDATIVPTKAGRAVVFGNGYDSVNQTAVLFLLNPETGALIRKLDTGSGGCNGLASPIVVDVDGDGYADFVFAGDLNGNMWKFDIRSDDSDEWKIYYNNGSPQPLLTAINSDGETQPITAAPEVMLDCAKSSFSSGGIGLMVIFGTGRYLNSDDFDDVSIQSIYGIWDWGDIWEEKEGGGDTGYAVAKTKFLGEIQSGFTFSNISGPSLLEQTVVDSSGDWLTLSDNAVDWYNPENTESPGSHMGWVFDLPQTGERSVREPTLRMGVAIFVSITPSSSPCDAGGSSVVYQVNACSGGRTDDPQFDVDNDEEIEDSDLINDLPPTGKQFDQMLFKPLEIPDNLYFSDSEGNINLMQVPFDSTGMQFWRVIQ